MWGGSPYRNDKPEALESLPQVRELIFAGKNMEAQDLIRKLLCREAWYALSDNRQFDYRNPRT